MKVLFIIRALPYYTAELANALAREGHEVGIALTDDGGGFIGSGTGDIHSEYRAILEPGVCLDWIHIPPRTSLRTVAGNLRSIASIAKLIVKHRADIVHVHEVADYRIYAAAWLTKGRRSVALTIHDAEYHPGEAEYKAAFIMPRFRRVADVIIVHGEDVKRRLLAASGEIESRVHIVPHGAYTLYRRWMSPDAQETGRNVLFFGRILKYKGLDYLIRSAPTVCRRVPDAKFVIAGSGPDWPRCQALIENQESFVLHNGAVPDPEVTRLFQEAAVVVLPYTEASQSGVLMIAYAMGKPAIVTDVGALPEAVEDGVTGLIVPPRNEEALADAIVRLLEDPDLRQRMGARAYELATAGEFSWDRIARRTAEIYSRACR